LKMIGGECAKANIDYWDTWTQNSTCPSPVRQRNRTVNFQRSEPVELAYPCSHFSSAPTASPVTRDPTWVLPLVFALAGLLLVGCAAVGVGWWWYQREQNKPPQWRVDMYNSVSEQCGGDQSWTEARLESEALGVNVSYITHELLHEARIAADLRVQQLKSNPPGEAQRFPVDVQNPNFYTLAPVMCYGETAKGSGIQCPRDRQPNCAVVDALYQLGTGKAGRAGHFLSWVWSYRVEMFAKSIEAWLTMKKLPAETTHVWVCFFCNNQFRLLEDSSNSAGDLEVVFERCLRSAGSMVAMLDTWEQPVYLTRCWTYVAWWYLHL